MSNPDYPKMDLEYALEVVSEHEIWIDNSATSRALIFLRDHIAELEKKIEILHKETS